MFIAGTGYHPARRQDNVLPCIRLTLITLTIQQGPNNSRAAAGPNNHAAPPGGEPGIAIRRNMFQFLLLSDIEHSSR